jgi:hypothetical protein
MGENRQTKKTKKAQRIGFVAYYHGKEVASSTDFGKLTNNAIVKELLGHKEFVIKHNVPEDVIAVYQNRLS